MSSNRRDDSRVVWGLTSFHSETGTEGGYWAVQDVRSYDIDRYGSMASVSYYGLLTLEEGDEITIYSGKSFRDMQAGESDPLVPEDAEVLWEGEVHLIEHPPFTQDAHGLWIHSSPRNADKEQWAELFLKPHPCRLIRKSREPYPVGIWKVPQEGYDGIYYRPEGIIFMSDGTMQWRGRVNFTREWPPYEMRRLMGRMRKAERADLAYFRVSLEIAEEYPGLGKDDRAREIFDNKFTEIQARVDAWVVSAGGIVNGFSRPEKYLTVALPPERADELKELEGVKEVSSRE